MITYVILIVNCTYRIQYVLLWFLNTEELRSDTIGR